MNTVVDLSVQRSLALQARLDAACARIAPTWPLDRLIAVNPYWGWRDRPMPEVAAQLASLSGARLLPPLSAFREHWRAGRLTREHLQAAADGWDAATPVDTLVALLEGADSADGPDAEPPPLPLLTDIAAGPGEHPGPWTWRDVVTHQISQHCAAFFDRHQAAWHPDAGAALYPGWRWQMAHEHGLAFQFGLAGLTRRVGALPDEPLGVIEFVVDALGVPAAAQQAWFEALLLSVNGWASSCAHEHWQARLAGGDSDLLLHLLAIRAAWEWLLDAQPAPAAARAGWAIAWTGQAAYARQLQADQQPLWLLQRALERAYQQPLCKALAQPPAAAAAAPPAVQAVFCIDVRSEVFRRALEASGNVQTRGFAGFFGLPIDYTPLGTAAARPQLPGLLAPALHAGDGAGSTGLGQALARRRRAALQWRQAWQAFRVSASSAFSFVETCGLTYAGKLLAASLARPGAPAPADSGLSAAERAALRPELQGLDAAAAAELAAGVLRTMGLTRGFAPLVLLAGHGSQSANNPHAAGLDCGACGGQTGEVNARVLARLLNNPDVRQALLGHGIAIGPGTQFVAGLHNTTTDELALHDHDLLPPGHADALTQLRGWLQAAGARARTERAGGLDLTASDHAAPLQALRRRAHDWAQVRPEWGLADNAAFIVAPRERTRHLNLQGRSFLHDYDWAGDTGFATLEAVMTAPMVVTNWINLQYHASAVDPQRYGSGNKVLHNVVGGRLGVFEGNGGDLRIGLPWQSVHDGQRLRHTPLRLSVFIEAPQAAIDAVIARHAVVRDLVDHEWLHLLRIDEAGGGVWQRRPGGTWVAA